MNFPYKKRAQLSVLSNEQRGLPEYFKCALVKSLGDRGSASDPRHSNWWDGVDCPLPNLIPALGPSGLEPRAWPSVTLFTPPKFKS